MSDRPSSKALWSTLGKRRYICDNTSNTGTLSHQEEGEDIFFDLRLKTTHDSSTLPLISVAQS